MKAIFKREFKAYFQTVVGFVFLAANLFLIGIYFTAYNMAGAYPYFSYTLSSATLVFFIAIPILTMRILAEDKKNKTDQLILTSPVSIFKIVLGKYLAVAAIVMIVIAVISTYPLIMSMFGTVPMKETYTAVLGFALYGLASAAVGVFISSLTENQIIACVVSFVVLFATYLMKGICSLIASRGNILTKILETTDFAGRFQLFINGSLEIGAVVYFITVIALMLFLTMQSIQKRRYSISVKNIKMGAYSTGAIILAIALAVFINIGVGKIPEKYTVFDMTGNDLYTITDETKEMLGALDEDVNVYVLSKEDGFETNTAEMLRRYEMASKHISVEYIDPVENPQFYTQYTSATPATGSIIVVSDEASKLIDYNDLYQYEYAMDNTTGSYTKNTTGYDAEGQLTSAIAYVTGDSLPVVYYATGHGETELEDDFVALIEKANASYLEWDVIKSESVPEDASAVIVNMPTGDWSKNDTDKLDAYIKNGGSVLMNLIPGKTATPTLYSFLGEYGAHVEHSFVMEDDKNYYYSDPIYLLPDVKSTKLTTDIYNKYYIFAPYTIQMKWESDDDSLFAARSLVTSKNAYGREISDNLSGFDREDTDTDGPFDILVDITKKNGDTTGRMIVNASGQAFTSSSNALVAGANSLLFGSIINSLVDNEMNISIPVKSINVAFLTMSSADVAFWRLMLVVLLPVVLLAEGFLVWLKRRKK